MSTLPASLNSFKISAGPQKCWLSYEVRNWHLLIATLLPDNQISYKQKISEQMPGPQALTNKHAFHINDTDS